MGKGDRRSRRGKLYRGTFGKKRPKHKARRKPVVTRSSAKPAAKATAKKAASKKA